MSIATKGNDVWVLDTGVSNHTTGCLKEVASLDESVRDTVRFGNGLLVTMYSLKSTLFQN